MAGDLTNAFASLFGRGNLTFSGQEGSPTGGAPFTTQFLGSQTNSPFGPLPAPQDFLSPRQRDVANLLTPFIASTVKDVFQAPPPPAVSPSPLVRGPQTFGTRPTALDQLALLAKLMKGRGRG